MSASYARTSLSVGCIATIAMGTMSAGANTSLGGRFMTGSNPSQPPMPSSSNSTTYVDERLLTAKLEAVEARAESKFSQLLGELKVISVNVSNLSTQMSEVKTELSDVKKSTAAVRWNILATGLAIGGLILALASYGQQMMQIALGLVGLNR
jgi:hypothetical protein